MPLPTPTRQQIENPELLHRLITDAITAINAMESSLKAQTGTMGEINKTAAEALDRAKKNVLANSKYSDQALVALGFDNADQARSQSAQRDRAPTVNDDLTQGYTFFSPWIRTDTAPRQFYILTDPKPGAAVWRRLD